MKKNTVEDFYKRYKIMDNGCWEWQHLLDHWGYAIFSINAKKVRAHRYSYELHVGQIPNGLYVCHHCDNRKCVNPNHLFVGTQRDNMHDMIEKNRKAPTDGKNNPRAKLSEQDVLEIRNSLETCRKLGKKYNVHNSIISDIKNRKIWTNI